MQIKDTYQNYLSLHNIHLDQQQKQILEALCHLHCWILEKSKTNLFNFFLKDISNKVYGIYLYGEVGRGKTMLLNILFELLPIQNKTRFHFHNFMSKIHQLIFEENNKTQSQDSIIKVAKIIASQTKLIFIDELQVNDIADAMVVGRLFKELFKNDIILLISSNRHPNKLYEHGLQREKFLEFIKLIQEKMDVIELSSPTDYRLIQLKTSETRYFLKNHEYKNSAEKFFNNLTQGNEIVSKILHINDREITINKTCKSACLVTFEEMCHAPLGAADYEAICNNFDIVFLIDISQMSKENRNEAKRFTTLIDLLYDHKILLICSADVAPQKLYEYGDGAFEFERTVSRLIEMQSEQYLANSKYQQQITKN